MLTSTPVVISPILSSHLFYGHQILEWSYAEEPFKVVWCVREDGILLSRTLIKEQDMYGWGKSMIP